MRILYLIFILLSVKVCSAQDTLFNFPSTIPLTSYPATVPNASCYGYLTGMNCFQREMYGEKFFVNGEWYVTGVLSGHTGYVSTPTRKLQIEIYSVGNDFPFQKLGYKEVFYGDLKLNGDCTYVQFDQPIKVDDDFFVVYNLMDYAHEAVTDSIGLLCAPDGTRNAGDVYGRNVVKLHHEGWNDLYTKTNLRTHLALFPIVVKTLDVRNKFSSPQDVVLFPNPNEGRFSLTTGSDLLDDVKIKVFDSYGREVPVDFVSEVNDGVVEVKVMIGVNGIFVVEVEGINGVMRFKLMVDH